jgi:hypothetical protein
MRQRLTGLLSVVSAFVILASCGGGGPTAPQVTPTSITINSTSAFIVLGQTETFSATIAFSNGTTQPLTGGAWGSDALGVASVGTTTGLVTSVNSGDVTIFVDAQGIRGTKRITIVPNYQGFWGGRYVVTSCSQTGGWAALDFCTSLFPTGADLPVAFNLTQTGGTVSGLTAIGGFVSNLFTTVAVAGGGLVFQAAYQEPTGGIAQAWQLNQTTPGLLTGTVVQTWSDTSLLGQMVVGATLLTVTKSSAQPLSMLSQSPRASLADIAAAIRGR